MLVGNGFAVTGYELDEDRRRKAEALGVTLAANPLDVLRTCEVVVFSLPTVRLSPPVAASSGASFHAASSITISASAASARKIARQPSQPGAATSSPPPAAVRRPMRRSRSSPAARMRLLGRRARRAVGSSPAPEAPGLRRRPPAAFARPQDAAALARERTEARPSGTARRPRGRRAAAQSGRRPAPLAATSPRPNPRPSCLVEQLVNATIAHSIEGATAAILEQFGALRLSQIEAEVQENRTTTQHRTPT